MLCYNFTMIHVPTSVTKCDSGRVAARAAWSLLGTSRKLSSFVHNVGITHTIHCTLKTTNNSNTCFTTAAMNMNASFMQYALVRTFMSFFTSQYVHNLSSSLQLHERNQSSSSRLICLISVSFSRKTRIFSNNFNSSHIRHLHLQPATRRLPASRSWKLL